MGKFKTHEFRKESEAGVKFFKKVDFYVNVDGEFYFKPDEALELNCTKLMKTDLSCYFGKNRNIYSKKYENLCDIISNAIDLILKTEKKVDRIIAYYFHFSGGYYLNGKGEIHPNGYLAGEGSDRNSKGGWVEGMTQGSHFDRVESYQIQIYAKVLDKITFSNGETTKVIFEESVFREGNHLLIDDEDNPLWAEKLNAFTDMGFRESTFSMHKKFEIPYTEEAAKYFYDVVHGMCLLNEKLKNLNNAQVLLEMIEQNQNLLEMK